MPTRLITPDYDGLWLGNILPSIHAHFDNRTGQIPLPDASRYVVFLVDGLGWNVLHQYLDHTDWLASAFPHAQRLTAGIPSTTSCSLSSLGTGATPGGHGIVGYTFRNPETQHIMNSLTWENGPDELDEFIVSPTMYHQLNEHGHPTAAVSLARFEHSGLSHVSFQGTRHFGIQQEGDISEFIYLVTEALASHDVVYAYERQLDYWGHTAGHGSYQWLDLLAHVDDTITALAEALPADTALLITGDHGMLNVSDERKLVIAETPGLDGADLVGGEARFRHVYTTQPAEVAAQWQDVLGEKALVVQREDAIKRGWFGPTVNPAVMPRLGDVLVAMRDDWALLTTRDSHEAQLVGMHGSLTAQEMHVPLLSYRS